MRTNSPNRKRTEKPTPGDRSSRTNSVNSRSRSKGSFAKKEANSPHTFGREKEDREFSKRKPFGEKEYFDKREPKQKFNYAESRINNRRNESRPKTANDEQYDSPRRSTGRRYSEKQDDFSSGKRPTGRAFRDSGRSFQKPGRPDRFSKSEEAGETKGRKSSFDRPVKRDADYNPHAKYSLKKQIEYKKQNLRATDTVRLNRFLANAGICSRREADDYIKAGVVSVNGEIVTELGTKVLLKDKVLFHDQIVKSEKKIYILINKPKDCVTTSDDPQERFTVMDLIKDACNERVYPVGRLDRNTTGVLLLTNDGDMAARLTHPKYNKKKIYHVFLDKPLTKAHMEDIANGITLEDGEIHADKISYVEEADKKQVGIEIHSGRNRIVRRIFEYFGYKVEKLDRVYFAGLTKKNLPRGKYRFLTEKEISMLQMGAFE